MAMMVRECRASAVKGSSGMKRAGVASLAIAAILGFVSVIPAHTAPPTVTPSPGYDARLQEQRTTSVREPVAPVVKPVAPRRVKRAPAH